MSGDRPLIEDPEIAANIRRLSEQTGVPVSRYEQWLAEPAPEGIDPHMWRSALATRARRCGPWPEAKLRALGLFAEESTPSRSASDAA